MSKFRDELHIPLPSDKAGAVVRQAVADCGWGIKEQGPGRVVARVGFGATRNPSSIEVLTRDDQGAGSLVVLNGRILGVGPIQKGHLKAEVGKLANAIKVAVASAQKDAPAPGVEVARSTMADRLRELASLRDEGLLTDDEFAEQKAKVLADE